MDGKRYRSDTKLPSVWGTEYLDKVVFPGSIKNRFFRRHS